MTSDVEALTRALGELAVSLHQRRRGCHRNAEKDRVLRWLRSLKSEELASLCCVEDVAFVKTLLHMAARSRGHKPLIQEFQLLPQSLSGSTVTLNKRTTTKTPVKAAPR